MKSGLQKVDIFLRLLMNYSKDKQQLTPEEWCEEKGYNKYYSMIINQYLTDIQ